MSNSQIKVGDSVKRALMTAKVIRVGRGVADIQYVTTKSVALAIPLTALKKIS